MAQSFRTKTPQTAGTIVAACPKVNFRVFAHGLQHNLLMTLNASAIPYASVETLPSRSYGLSRTPAFQQPGRYGTRSLQSPFQTEIAHSRWDRS